MDSDNTFLNHKLNKLQQFINCNQITFQDLSNICYKIDNQHKCTTCYNEYNQYNEIKDLFQSFSKKINKSIKETILILEKKGIVKKDLIKTYKKYKKRFVNGNFDYCHYNSLISLKKLEFLLKSKNINNYNSIFENVKYNCKDFYCCPHFKRPEKKIKLNLSDLTSDLPQPKVIINNTVIGESKEFVNDLVIENKNSEPIIWETKKTKYIKKNPIKIRLKKVSNLTNQELEINYSPFLKEEVQNLLSDLNYNKEKDKLIEKIDYFEYLTDLYPDNKFYLDQLFKLQHNFENNYYGLDYSNSETIINNVVNLVYKHINLYNNEEDLYDFSNISNKDKLISAIKNIKYNLSYGYEIIDSCNLLKNIKILKVNIDDKIDYHKKLEKSLIKKYNKITMKKENIDDV